MILKKIENFGSLSITEKGLEYLNNPTELLIPEIENKADFKEPPSITATESGDMNLLNKLKDNHLLINQLKSQNISLKDKVEQFEKDFSKVKVENESLKVTNSLLGGKEDKFSSKRKINNLIKEVDFCINQLSDFENQNE